MWRSQGSCSESGTGPHRGAEVRNGIFHDCCRLHLEVILIYIDLSQYIYIIYIYTLGIHPLFKIRRFFEPLFY